jgi:hypothetical protein
MIDVVLCFLFFFFQNDFEEYSILAKTAVHAIKDLRNFKAHMRQKYRDTPSDLATEAVAKIFESSKTIMEWFIKGEKSDDIPEDSFEDDSWLTDEVIQGIDKTVDDHLEKIKIEKEKKKSSEQQQEDDDNAILRFVF